MEREKVLRHADEEAAAILEQAQNQEEEILRSASQQAELMIADGEQQVDEMRKQAQAEAEAVKEQAKQAGHKEGLSQGLNEARQQVSGIAKEFKQLIAQGQKILQEMIQNQEREIRTLVVDIAGRVIQQKIAVDDEIVVRVAQECIRQAADRQTLRVLVHPDDQKKIEEWAPEFSRLFDDVEKITISADPRVKRGGVLIESGAGGIDGRIDKQTEILDNIILNP